MKKIILAFFAFPFCTSLCNAKAQDTSKDIENLKQEISILCSKQMSLERNVLNLANINKDAALQMKQLKKDNDSLYTRLDSVQYVCHQLAGVQKTDKESLSNKINQTDKKAKENNELLATRTNFGILVAVLLLCSIIGAIWIFQRKFKNSSNTIDNVRKAQDTLQSAQKQLQEESVRLDNKMLEIAERQMSTVQTSATEPDHDLAKKVADEIVRIEMNLSRMDASIKGYKQLSKAVQRIKDNFSANGYEIVDMLGKPYNEGMKVVANFVPDENLKEGEQVITGIIKPQINFRGVMIQSAQITVSQNI